MAAAATRCGEEGGAAAMSGALARAHADSCAVRVQQLACRVRPLLPLPAIENVLGEQAATQEKMAAPTDEASPTTKGIALEDWLALTHTEVDQTWDGRFRPAGAVSNFAAEDRVNRNVFSLCFCNTTCSFYILF